MQTVSFPNMLRSHSPTHVLGCYGRLLPPVDTKNERLTLPYKAKYTKKSNEQVMNSLETVDKH